MIECLHDRGGTISFFQRITNWLELRESIDDAGAFCGQNADRPGLQVVIAPIAGNAIDHLKYTDDNMVGVGEIEEILLLLRGQGSQKWKQISSGGGLESEFEKCVYVLLFTLNYIGHERKKLLPHHAQPRKTACAGDPASGR